MAKCMCCGGESRFMGGHTCDFFHVSLLDLVDLEDGVVWMCPDCERAFEAYARECGRKWLRNTKVQKAARRRAYQKAYQKAYYKAHREKQLAYQKAYREKKKKQKEGNDA